MFKTASTLQTWVPVVTAYWARLVPWQRRCLLIAVGITAIVLAWSVAPRGTRYVPLFGDQVFDRRQLTRLEAALGRANLVEYQLRDGQLHVPASARPRYLAALDEASALPDAIGDETRRELERINFFESADQRRRRLQDAQRREVTEIVRSLEGIDDAYVQFSESTAERFSGKRQRSAMVAVRLAPQQHATPRLIQSLRSMVSSFQAGMPADAVTIIDLNTGRTFAQAGSVLAATDEYLFVKQTFERLFTTKLQRHLDYVTGLRIAANVELKRVERTVDPQSQPMGHWVPEVVSASLSVPASYVAGRLPAASQEDAQQRSAREDEVLEEIRRAAATVLPSSGNSAPRVTVALFEEPRPLPSAGGPWKLLSSGTAITGAIGLFLLAGLAALGVYQEARRLRTPVPTPNISPAATHTAHALRGDQPLAESNPPSPRVHERLAELVRENPKLAAETITQWVRKAG